jgi:hypothetical protein
VELILDRFGAASVDAFDLDPRMIALATTGCAGDKSKFGFGSVTPLPSRRQMHRMTRSSILVLSTTSPTGASLWPRRTEHEARWRLLRRRAIGASLNHPFMHRFCAHPVSDRFEATDFCRAVEEAGLSICAEKHLWFMLSWLVARKSAAIPSPAQSRTTFGNYYQP